MIGKSRSLALCAALVLFAAVAQSWAGTVVKNNATWERSNWYGQNGGSWAPITWSDTPSAAQLDSWKTLLGTLPLTITGDSNVWEQGGTFSYWYNNTGSAPKATRARATFTLSAAEVSSLSSAKLIGEFVTGGRVPVNDRMVIWVNGNFVSLVIPDSLYGNPSVPSLVGWHAAAQTIPVSYLVAGANTIDILGVEGNDAGGMGKLALSFTNTSVFSNTTDWKQSTTIGSDNTIPWSGVLSVPAPATFTVTPSGGAGHVANVAGSTNLFSGAGVRYYRTTVSLPSFGTVSADIQLSVDNDIQIFINGHSLALEGSLSGENFAGLPHHRIFIGANESVTNGYLGGNSFDTFSPTFSKSNWISGGTNEIILAVRNLSGGDTGGFSFGMTLTTTLNPPNLPPVANAGSDRTVEAAGATTAVILDGSFSSDPEGESLTYAWSGSFGSATGVTPTVNLPLGTHTISLTVTDGQGLSSAADQVVVNVRDTAPPVVTLSGSDPMTVECHTTFTDPGAAAVDLIDGTQPVATSSTVNPNVVGTYTLTYTATDTRGNSASKSRTVNVVDTTAPTIALTGANPVTLECPLAYTEPGTSVSDACDPNPTLSISGDVDSHTPGTYTITYIATDASGNTFSATRTVNVVDTTAPTIALTGANPVTLECPVAYAEPGTSVSDACDPNPTLSISGIVDNHTPGAYTITYTATDASHNTYSVTRIVNVVDGTAPVITLNGSATVTAECHVAYVDAGAMASDDCDPAPAISFTSTLNNNQLGAYTITYVATDASGNVSLPVSRTITVVDTTPPSLVLNGASPLTLECPVAYVEPGAQVSDTCDPQPTLVISGSVDTHTPGVYAITYTVTDHSGNSTSAIRTIHTVDTTAPVTQASLSHVRGHKGDDDDDDEGSRSNYYRISLSAADACDTAPAITAYIAQPLVPTSAITVTYKRERKNRIEIKQEKKGIRVKLEGPSQAALRSLLDQALATGGFSVTDGQVVKLTPTRQGRKDDDDKGESQYQFDGSLKLTSAKGPGIRLVAFATDDAGNKSTVAEVVPSRSSSAKLVGEGSVPTSFSLEPNYPNPFNPATTLRYNLVEAGLVQLTVYNVVGQQVRVLIDQVQEAGGYQVEWDATDATGQRVAPGLYLYRLTAGDQAAVGKMLLVK